MFSEESLTSGSRNARDDYRLLRRRCNAVCYFIFWQTTRLPVPPASPDIITRSRTPGEKQPRLHSGVVDVTNDDAESSCLNALGCFRNRSLSIARPRLSDCIRTFATMQRAIGAWKKTIVRSKSNVSSSSSAGQARRIVEGRRPASRSVAPTRFVRD